MLKLDTIWDILAWRLQFEIKTKGITLKVEFAGKEKSTGHLFFFFFFFFFRYPRKKNFKTAACMVLRTHIKTCDERTNGRTNKNTMLQQLRWNWAHIKYGNHYKLNNKIKINNKDTDDEDAFFFFFFVVLFCFPSLSLKLALNRNVLGA